MFFFYTKFIYINYRLKFRKSGKRSIKPSLEKSQPGGEETNIRKLSSGTRDISANNSLTAEPVVSSLNLLSSETEVTEVNKLFTTFKSEPRYKMNYHLFVYTKI